jgi:hypothetical protein
VNFKLNADGTGFEWSKGRPVMLDGGPEETAQRLHCNLSTVVGELAFIGEPDRGFLELSDDFLGKVPNVQKVRSRARQKILGTKGVASLQQIEVEEPEGSSRSSRMTFHATDETGASLEGEVTGS